MNKKSGSIPSLVSETPTITKDSVQKTKKKPKAGKNEKTSGEQNEVQKYYNRDVWLVTTNAAKTKIESRVKQLEKISTEILTNIDLAHEEKEAHKYLCDILRKVGCDVHSSYIHPTAFKAVFQSSSLNESSNAPTVGLICEYDAVKGFGHSSGNNLSTEATIAALIGIREAMKVDTRLVGRLVIFGTPASEESGGKIGMMKEGAFDKVDCIVMVSPANKNCLRPTYYCSQKIRISFSGLSRHIDCLNTLEGQNPVDAAVICYHNLTTLSNQIQPNCRINYIIKKGGDVDYLVPKKSELMVCIRSPQLEDLDIINRRIVDCGESAAAATQTKVEFDIFDEDMYCAVNHNKVLTKVFKEEAIKLGMRFGSNAELRSDPIIYRSSDLGNVSYKVPLISPSFSVGVGNEVPVVHSRDFATAITRSEAQTNTIKASIAMTFTIIKYFLNQSLRDEVRKQFTSDLEDINKRAMSSRIQK